MTLFTALPNKYFFNLLHFQILFLAPVLEENRLR